MSLRTPTPWGAQTLWAATDQYAAKILEIEPGHRTSLQHHVQKTETLLVLEGDLVAEVGEATLVLGPGDRLHLPAGTVHRLGSRGGVRLVEVSTPELDDVVRHEDDYGRCTRRTRRGVESRT